MASEAMEDCVQGALSSLYPPFESTAPPLLSQVFTVLESTYQQDSLRYLLDYFVPAKHLLHKLQQHACSQYLGCLFLHSGWPLCLGSKVVVQLSTLDWRLLRSNDFYLQVVPFSTRCPRLALKCLAPGGRTVQEILVPESQHPLVFTSEWLHSINKERGHRREAGGGLDTCLVSTCDGVLRLPWKEVVYPEFIHDPSEEARPPCNPDGYMSKGLTEERSRDSWGWAEEEEEKDKALLPDGLASEPALPRRRRSEDGLGRTARYPELDGDYVELLEPRGGPDGGVDPRHRYLEMHGICKTKTLPLCKRGMAIKLRRGKLVGGGQMDNFGSVGGICGPKSNLTAPKDTVLEPGLPSRVTQTSTERQSFPYPAKDNNGADNGVDNGGDITKRDTEGRGSHPFKERRPGVGGEGEMNKVTQPKREESEITRLSRELPDTIGHVIEGCSDPGSHSDSVFEDTDKPQSGDSDAATPTWDAPDKTFAALASNSTRDSKSAADSNNVTANQMRDDGKKKIRECTRGKEVKACGFRPPRRKRRGKGAKGKARPSGRAFRGGSKTHGKAHAHLSSTSCSGSTRRPITEELCSEPSSDGECLSENATTSSAEADSLPVCNGLSAALTTTNEEVESGDSCKETPLLRELNTELLWSGQLRMPGTVDRLGRALVMAVMGDSGSGEEMARILACYHRITRSAAKEKGLTVLIDSRRSPPSSLCLSTLRLFQRLVPGGLGAVLFLVENQQPSFDLEGIEVHMVRGTAVLEQFVDRQQLPTEMGGEFSHCHSDWLSFRLSLESLTERCESALRLLGEALQSMDAEPTVDNIKEVPASTDKHRRLMASVLADSRLTELQRGGGAWLAGLTNSGLAQTSPDCRAALATASKLYDSVDDALHRLVRVSNRRARNLDALGRLAGLVNQLEKCDEEIERVQSQVHGYKDPPLSLSRLSLQQQKFKQLREAANELHSRTLSVLTDLETWNELDWVGLNDIQIQLPSFKERLRDMSHCLSDRWTALDNTQRLLSTLTEASQWCDEVSSASPVCPLASLPPIPPSRFQDARSLAVDLGGGALLDLWSRTVERYQQTVAQVKPRFLQSERGQNQGQGKAKTPIPGNLWDAEGEGDWESGSRGSEGGLQSWGSLASLFRPQTCSTLKIGDEKGYKKEAAGGGGNFLQNLLKKSPTEAPLPAKPPRKRHPSFDLQALLAPRRGAGSPKAAECRTSPKSWLGRRALVDPVVTTGMAAAVQGGGGVLIRGVEVSSKEVVDHTGSPRQHVLLGRTEREMGTERSGSTVQSKLYLLWCRMLSSERQYVAVLKGVQETYLSLLELSDTPESLRGKADSLFPCWADLTAFHSQELLPAMEDALVQSLLQQDCFSKFRDHFLHYSHYIRTKPELDSPLVTQAADFFKSTLPGTAASPLSPLCFPQCLQAPPQRLEQYCEALEELGGINPTTDSTLSILRHAQQHGEDLRASDLIVGCPIPVAERGELVRQGELTVCGGTRRKRVGVRRVFLYQHAIIFTKQKSGGGGGGSGGSSGPGRLAYSYKHSMKTADMGLTQSVGEDGVKFEVWIRQAPRLKDCVTLQARDGEQRKAWTRDVARLLWTHAINSTELCLKESLCVGVSSKLLLDASASQTSDLERVHSSCSDSSSVGSHKEGGGSPASGRGTRRSSASCSQGQSPSTAV
ncbi:rho guanine nucleotide exchange factor 40 isoform X1 [Hippocampus zosterae]|uniref:rho guanine nucleotide exchange factor 40 isoform X1 n=1 Tax=Hippocampus zosterae TaxID=109293 RepID=UPI00223CBC88|nr:rho guanine nucleotide exchange factor 40 isoform X1 [Hippocampus zosterae]